MEDVAAEHMVTAEAVAGEMDAAGSESSVGADVDVVRGRFFGGRFVLDDSSLLSTLIVPDMRGFGENQTFLFIYNDFHPSHLPAILFRCDLASL